MHFLQCAPIPPFHCFNIFLEVELQWKASSCPQVILMSGYLIRLIKKILPFVVHGEQEMNAKVCKTTGCPKKRIFKLIILQADTSERSDSRRLEFDLSEVSTCRMMILKVRFLGHPVVICKSWHPQVVSLLAVYQKTEYTSHSMSKYIVKNTCCCGTNGVWLIENERFCDIYRKEAAGGDGVHGRGGTFWPDLH